MLICDGASLLAYLGVFRSESYAPREQRLFQQLVPSLRRRLELERLLECGRWSFPALDATLENLPAAAYVITGTGRF